MIAINYFSDIVRWYFTENSDFKANDITTINKTIL
jgi:hypothetical protein